jgi:hypothetical protein
MWKLTLLTGLWTLAVVYAAWFGIQVWTDPGVMLWVGHQFSLLLWGAPLLPLVVLTWWLLKRWTGRPQTSPPIFLLGWIALILLPPPPQPMTTTIPGQPDVTAVATSFWMVLALVIVLPVVLTTAVWLSTITARRAVRPRG